MATQLVKPLLILKNQRISGVPAIQDAQNPHGSRSAGRPLEWTVLLAFKWMHDFLSSRALHRIGYNEMARLPAVLTTIYGLFAFGLPVVALLASQGVVLLVIIAAALAGIVAWRTGHRLPWPNRNLVAAIIALVAWCAIASSWSFQVVDGLILAARIAFLFAAGFLLYVGALSLDDTARERICRWLLVGLALTLLVAAVEVALGFPLFTTIKGWGDDKRAEISMLNRGATAVAIFVWPATAALWQRGWDYKALALPAVAGVILSFLASATAIVGFVAGAVVFGVALLHHRAARLLLVLLTVFALFGSPVAAKLLYEFDWHNAEWTSASFRHRVEIWNFNVDLIKDKPVRGWGFDSARDIGKQRLTSPETGRSYMPLHPHNGGIQVLLELGLVGALIVFTLLLILITRLDTLRSPPARAGGQAAFAAAVVVASAAFGLWQNQWLATMIGAAALIPLTCTERGVRDRGCAERI